MRGKHSNPLIHALATVSRERLRWKIAGAAKWDRLVAPDPGCTAIIGVCSRLPDVLAATVRCLHRSRWPELKRLVLAVDCTRESFPEAMELAVKQTYPDLRIDFLFYSQAQAALTKKLELPFVYCWLSWCNALAEVRTQHVLVHDYDALVVGPTLDSRYREFVRSGAKFQGISWYKSNGIEEADRLATTFEAFVDVPWLRSFDPIMLFNKLRVVDGRSLDLDITLDIQQRTLSGSERAIMPMDLDQLVHPSQMVHQYTMFRHSPGAALPCFSVPMIPFFAYLGGNKRLLEHATAHLEADKADHIDFLGDGTQFNFLQLGLAQVDWALKQMVKAFLALEIAPDPKVFRYGLGLYRIIGAEQPDHWRGDFTAEQREWIEAASMAHSTSAPAV